jgi:hypothetical protein
MKKLILSLSTVIFFALGSIAYAAPPCGSGEAAERGGDSGYGKDQESSDETAQRDRENNDILDQCIGAVIGTPTAPQFPSLSDIFDQILNEICEKVREQVSKAGNQIPRQNYDLSGLYQQAVSSSYGSPASLQPQSANTVLPSTQLNSESLNSEQYWNDVFK